VISLTSLSVMKAGDLGAGVPEQMFADAFQEHQEQPHQPHHQQQQAHLPITAGHGPCGR
jgi:hypothetical protein